MTIAYTNLGLITITTGTESGLWGGYTNTNVCDLLPQAISGYGVQAMNATTDVTMTISNGAPSPGRNMYIKCTGAMSQLNNLIVPTNPKLYFIENATTGGFGITVKTAAGAGITVPNGSKMTLMCNGTDVIEAIANLTTAGVFTTLSVSGTVSGAGFTAYLASPPAIGGTLAAAGTFTTLTVNGASVPVNGVYLPSANTLGFASNTLSRATVNSTGNWDFVAPTSGIGATFNSVSGTHSMQIGDTANTKYNAGYLEIPSRGVTASYPIVLADSGKQIYYTGSAAAQTITIPANGSVAFPIGTTLMIINDASAAVTISIAITSDVLVQAGTATPSTGTRTLARYGIATAVKVTATRWFISGPGVS